MIYKSTEKKKMEKNEGKKANKQKTPSKTQQTILL
jgi:hypothetical protein